MPYIVVEDFRAGLDSRRSIVSGPAGSLHRIVNAHITRGGDIEKRKAFVGVHSLPAGTFGCQALGDKTFVFGSTPEPVGIPAGVTYQRLQHPNGLGMTKLVMSKITDGKVFAIAKFADGKNLPFHDGQLVAQWVNGVATADMSSFTGLAAHFAAAINADTESKFTAVADANTLTVTGPDTAVYPVSVSTINVDGGNSNQEIVFEDVQVAVPSVAEVLGVAVFRITGGSVGPGANQILSVEVNGVAITGPAVDWDTSNEVTAQDLAANINAAATSPNFTAAAAGDQVTIKAPVGSGATYNGSTVSVNTKGNVTTCTGGIIITGGTSSPGVNDLEQAKVNGITVQQAAAIDWTTDNSVTASLLAASINAHTSSPDYNAFAIGPQVIISALSATNLTPNALPVLLTVGGDVTAIAVAIETTISNVSGGQAAVTGQAQKTKFTFNGSFEAGDKFYIKMGDHIFGADRVAGLNPKAALPLKDKVYVGAGVVMFFSGVATPKKFNSDAIGSGLINMSSNGGGSEDIVGLGIYRNNVAVFSRRSAQIWFVDPDPQLNRQLQVLDNIGTMSAKSIISFGDSDVFFLSDTGVRSLRVRDTTENVSAYDVGTPVDDYISDIKETLTEEEIADAVGAIEPTDGRYWLAIGHYIFVFSYFMTSKISAWSTYEPGFVVSDMTIKDGQLFARSGDTIYAYGGADKKTYDDTVAEAVLPYLDGEKPASFKTYEAVDAVLEGAWELRAGTDPENPDSDEIVAELDAVTLTKKRVAFTGNSTHVSLRLRTTGSGRARVEKLIVHYQGAEDD